MILSENTNIRLDHLVWFSALSEHQLDQLRADEQNSGIIFSIPEHIRTNRDKTTYKVGFLFDFLRKLYADKTIEDICKILNDRYQIFLEKRQILRHVKNFGNEKKFK